MVSDINDISEISDEDRAHTHLKQIMLQEINAQEQTQKILRKVFRRISVLYFIVAAVVVVGLMFLIYINSRPESKANEALKEMEALNTRIALQRQYIEMDREDLEKTRNSIKELTKIQDSLVKKTEKRKRSYSSHTK